jgi:hypothetical protein
VKRADLEAFIKKPGVTFHIPTETQRFQMKCPICKLEYPPDAVKCDCGYNFQFCRIEAPERVTGQAAALPSPESEEDTDERLRQFGWIVAVLFGLGILGVVVAILLGLY